MWAFTCVSTQRESSWQLAATRKEAQRLNQTQEKCLHAVSVLCRLRIPYLLACVFVMPIVQKRVVECKRVWGHKHSIYGILSGGGSVNIKEPVWCRTIILKKSANLLKFFTNLELVLNFFQTSMCNPERVMDWVMRLSMLVIWHNSLNGKHWAYGVWDTKEHELWDSCTQQ